MEIVKKTSEIEELLSSGRLVQLGPKSEYSAYVICKNNKRYELESVYKQYDKLVIVWNGNSIVVDKIFIEDNVIKLDVGMMATPEEIETTESWIAWNTLGSPTPMKLCSKVCEFYIQPNGF